MDSESKIIKCMTNTNLFSSEFINTMYENSLEDDDSIDKETFFVEQLNDTFQSYIFSRTDNVPLNYSTMKSYLDLFEKLQSHTYFTQLDI